MTHASATLITGMSSAVRALSEFNLKLDLERAKTCMDQWRAASLSGNDLESMKYLHEAMMISREYVLDYHYKMDHPGCYDTTQLKLADLTKSGPDISLSSIKQQNPAVQLIISLLMADNLEPLKDVIKAKGYNNINFYNDKSLLHIACKLKCVKAIPLLMALGANIDELDKFGLSPTLEAAFDNNTHVVECLLPYRPNLEYGNKVFGAPLCCASRLGNVKLAKKLLDEGAKVNQITECEQRTPLHEAADRCHLEVAQLLLQYGAAINAQDHCMRTPLLSLCSSLARKNVEDIGKMIDILLQAGANPLICDDFDAKASTLAQQEGYLEIEQKLLKAEIAYAAKMAKDAAKEQQLQHDQITASEENAADTTKPDGQDSPTGESNNWIYWDV